MIDLYNERLLIIRALSIEPDSGLIHDKFLPFTVKGILDDFSNPDSFIPESSKPSPSKKLLDTYKQYGFPVIRCILQNLTLLFSADELEAKTEDFLEQLQLDINGQQDKISLLLRELNRYAASPYEEVEKFISLIILKIGSFESILLDDNYSFDLKLIAVRQIVIEKMFRNYVLIRDLLIMEIKRDTIGSNFYLMRIFPLIKEYALTGPDGLELALESYYKNEFKIHGPIVLASFGDFFSQRIITNEPEIEPDTGLVKAICLSLGYIKNRANRDKLMLVLIDKWCLDGNIARETKKNLKEIIIRRREKYLSTLSDNVIRKINEFVDTSKERENISQNIIKIKNWARNGESKKIKQLSKYYSNGLPVAIALVECKNEKERMLIFNSIRESQHIKFFKEFFNTIIKPRHFQAISHDMQKIILGHTFFATAVNYNQLKTIRNFDLESDVKKTLLECMKEKEIAYASSRRNFD